ncbi:protein suppressor of forked isoform X2 [Planococcus citri]|uniref:protein suppressor of forked isoform X2 n=1 Tax=Planococcus citri TaxID=170843 RepID=UPI0031F7B321
MSNLKSGVVWGSEKLEKAEDAILENKWDMEAWGLLIREAQNRFIQDVRSFFEKLISVFPTSGRYWKMYIEMEMRGRNFEKVEQLFQRCLMKVLYIDLWKLYVAYVKETKSLLPTYKEKMAQAYDFAIDKIGLDIMSFTIWNDYVTFLKSVEAIGSYAENQKITAIRKVYQRAVITPMLNIETLWKDYLAYEQAINPIIAEKMLMERSKDYMNARRVAKELEIIIRGLSKNYPSIPPTGSAEEAKQVELWKKYISWEKSNPLHSEDTSLVTKRVMFAFEQCLLCMGHHPDFWYEAAQFLDQSAKTLTEKGDITAAKLFTEEAEAMFERAIAILKQNMLLHFAYADFEESHLKYDKVHQIYNDYLDQKQIDPTLAYIQYMKFARRAEGIKSARAIFKRAREDTRAKYQVFVAAALMEYYCSKDKNIAFRIFELGLKKFSNCPEYVICYIDYLSHLNEDNNTRVLFERILSSGGLEPAQSVEIWNRFLEFESNIGDLPSILKVEKRRSSVLEKIAEFEGKETAQIVDRYRFLDLYPCTHTELKSIGYNVVSKTVAKSIHSTSSAPNPDVVDDTDQQQTHLPKPDINQMIPYKPKINAFPGEHPIPGGSFPPPPTASHLMTILPPPDCFNGPFVGVDSLINLFNKMNLPDRPPAPKGDHGYDARLFEFASSVHYVDNEDSFNNTNANTNNRVKKRKFGPGGIQLDESDEEDYFSPPINDIYRLRQQKKVK